MKKPKKDAVKKLRAKINKRKIDVLGTRLVTLNIEVPLDMYSHFAELQEKSGISPAAMVEQILLDWSTHEWPY